MFKSNVIKKLEKSGVVAVVRGESKEQAKNTALACINGGVKAIELTFTAPKADEIISEILSENNDDEISMGAGTVLDPVTARIAIMAGAQFIVSPSFNKEVAKMCNLYQIPYMPGCQTITEIQTAMTYGSEVVKVFPGHTVGPDFVTAIKAPLPQVNVMPTGGVNLDNMADWFAKGVVMVGTGSDLTGAAKTYDYEAVKARATEYHEEFLKIKNR